MLGTVDLPTLSVARVYRKALQEIETLLTQSPQRSMTTLRRRITLLTQGVLRLRTYHEVTPTPALSERFYAEVFTEPDWLILTQVILGATYEDTPLALKEGN